MSDRWARVALLLGAAALAVPALVVDLPRLTGGRFWGDGATFYGMALSLAEDGDVRYEARDVLRIRREYAFGPQGLFLKRASGGLAIDRARGFPWLRRVAPDEPRLYYAKAWVYPLVAWPLVALFRTNGLLLTNVAFMGLTLWLGYGELRRRLTPLRALVLTLVLFLGTVTPLYLVWLTPEIFTLGIVTAGLVAWSRGRPALSAVLLGIATYAKPTNLLLALPLGLEPLLAALRSAEGSSRMQAFARGLAESVRRGAVLAAVTAALFGLNAALTGEMNYQGGERKTFDRKYPLEDHGLAFDNTGFWMTTEHLGPLVEGEDEALQTERTDPVRAAAELRGSFIHNLAYFWVGRFGGALAYFFPVVMAIILFLALGPRDPRGWLALAALLASYVFYIWLIPANWYGGGGAVGNRYFINLVPLALFFAPSRREWVVAGGGLLAAGVFLFPALVSPVQHSLNPGRHATYAPFLRLPLELTELNDLSIFTEPWRKKRPFGDTEGNRREGRAADPNAYYLYFPDDGTWGKEVAFGGEGFWLRGGQRAEVILRALEPVRRMTVRVTGGPAGDEVSLRVGSRSEKWVLRPGETQERVIEPAPGFDYYGTALYVLNFRSTRGQTSPEASVGEPRKLGTFVQLSLEAEPRPDHRRLPGRRRRETSPSSGRADRRRALGGRGCAPPP